MDDVRVRMSAPPFPARAGWWVAAVASVLWLGGCAAPARRVVPPADGAVPSAMVSPAAARWVVSVYIVPPLAQPAPMLVDAAPPPMLVEPPPPSTMLGVVWTGGYWAWQGEWVWAAGRWALPPRPGDVWVPPYYEHRDGAMVFIDAHWRSVRLVFTPPRPGLRIARAAVAPGAALGPLPTGPEGIVLPPPPGSRPGLVVPAPLGTPPALMMALPPVGQVGMRVSASPRQAAGRGIDVGLVRVTAPASATLDGHAHDASLPAEAYLAASMPSVVVAPAPTPRPGRALPSYEAGQPAPVLPAAQPVGAAVPPPMR